MSEDLGTEPISEDYDGPDPTDESPQPGSEQIVGDDESEYGGSGADGAERGPSEEDEDQGI